VMVARGDLAVEVGFERLAEVQEEILWLCEAAHVPAIWATQVLEGLAKKGVPSRAEVTDAATAVRAECVMLNKGPHVTEAVVFLDNVLRRMQAHQKKKSALLRRLSVAGDHDGSDRPVSRGHRPKRAVRARRLVTCLTRAATPAKRHNPWQGGCGRGARRRPRGHSAG
ncbi:MAG TPA: pyruvate kinase, partial [Polyangia bacterium]|nr:pyruvate kinase [Polyangia bacterium]